MRKNRKFGETPVLRTSVIRLSLGKLLVHLLQVVKWTKRMQLSLAFTRVDPVEVRHEQA